MSASVRVFWLVENRGTTVESADRRRFEPIVNHSTSSPTRPPSHSDPDVRCSQSNSREYPRGEVWAAWPAATGIIRTAAAASTAPVVATISAIDRVSATGRSSHSAVQAVTQNSPKHKIMST
jgi:hypothetical protein